VKNRKKVLAGIWTRVQRLGESAPQTDGKPEPGATSESATAQPEAAPAPRKAKGAPAKAKATKKATAAKAAPETKTVAKDAKAKGARKAKESGEPKAARTGSKSEEVIAMLKRKGGATMAEIMSHTGWQKHTTRGWVSGFLGKKMGIAVESFKSDNGERTYRINQ
jgi:membrane protein involved in colicin uptake